MTKTSESRLQDLMGRLQPRTAQPDTRIGNLPVWAGVTDVIINDTTNPSRLGNLTEGIIKHSKETATDG